MRQKKVTRDKGKTILDSLPNFLACIYLERHNFEVTAQNAIDGGVFVVSGRTNAVRASIVMDRSFREGFTNEKLYFGTVGPVLADDDISLPDTSWLMDGKSSFRIIQIV